MKTPLVKTSARTSYALHRFRPTQTDKFPFRALEVLVQHETCFMSKSVRNRVIGMCRNRDKTVVPLVKDLSETYREALTLKSQTEAFGNAYQIGELLTKFPFTGDQQKCRSAAVVRFNQAEGWCKRTNMRFAQYKSSYISESKRNSVAPTAVMMEARKICHQILGDVDLDSILRMSKHGSGVSHNPGSDRSAQETTAYFKMADTITCSPASHALVSRWIAGNEQIMELTRQECESVPGVGDTNNCSVVNHAALLRKIKIVSANRVTFVPKNSKTDRAIAIEPSGSLAIQTGVGSYLKTRLRKWGVDLTSQGKNQNFAKLGSMGIDTGAGPLATIDLAMASDTVSTSAVEALLPREWFSLLDSLRSKNGLLEGKEFKYHKFSSMGCGFTFELESLLFFCITLATMRVEGFNRPRHNDVIAVYGDDLVMPSFYSEAVIKSLRFFGFRVNSEKSFTSGPFRESCGKDFYLGKDVRPFYIKRSLVSPVDAYFIYNSCMKQYITTGSTVLGDVMKLTWKQVDPYMAHVVPIAIPSSSHEIRDYKEEKTRWGDMECGIMLPRSLAVQFDPSLLKCLPFYSRKGRDDQPHYQGCTLYSRLVRKTKKHTYNEPLVDEYRYLLFLSGHENGNISLRESYTFRTAKVPTTSWDSIPKTSPITQSDAVNYVYDTLFGG